MSLLIKLFRIKVSNPIDINAGTIKTTGFIPDDIPKAKTSFVPPPSDTTDSQVAEEVKSVLASKELFKEALKLVLGFEGGYTNDPADPGGETNFGITQKEYLRYRHGRPSGVYEKPISVKNITQEEVEDIYWCNYWLAGFCDQIGQNRLSIVHFDSCVNVGLAQAARFLQRSCGVDDDGMIGKETLAAVREANQLLVIPVYLEKRREFYQYLARTKPKLNKFLDGWLKRVDRLEEYVNHMS